MKPRTIKKHLKRLRVECIEGTDDLVLKRVAYEMETAIRRVTERMVAWPSLSDLAKGAAALIRTEFELERRARAAKDQP